MSAATVTISVVSLTARLDDEVIYAAQLTRERADALQPRACDDRTALLDPGSHRAGSEALRTLDYTSQRRPHLSVDCGPYLFHNVSESIAGVHFDQHAPDVFHPGTLQEVPLDLALESFRAAEVVDGT